MESIKFDLAQEMLNHTKPINEKLAKIRQHLLMAEEYLVDVGDVKTANTINQLIQKLALEVAEKD